MSFFSSSSSYKPQAQIRQEGFHPATPPPHGNFDLFNPFLPADSFRKFPSAPSPSMDFGDELASLMTPPDRSPPDDRYHRPTHNIFDISAPAPAPDYPPHFNQTLPALNSSLRYENEPNAPPSAFPHHFARHTPSPISASHPSRSRSRSRPPSSGGPPNAAGGIGPARTSRVRRNNSVGGTSPPPGRPHAIVIPRSRAATVSGNGNNGNNGWYIPGHSTTASPPQNPYSPFSLSSPPDNLHLPPVSALHSLHQQQQSYLHHGSPHSLPNIHTNLSVSAVHSLDRATAAAASPTSPHPEPTGKANSVSAADKQAILANEKRRRRRESHNAVERRRRDNINEKISELATLIPESPGSANTNPLPSTNGNGNAASPTNASADDPSSPLEWKKEAGATSPDANNSSSGTPPPPSAASTTTTTTGGEGAGIVKANKGMILRKSVEYIRYLQQLVEAQGARNRELEAELKVWRGGATPAQVQNVNGDAQGQGQGVANGEGQGMDLTWNGHAGAGYGASGGFFGLPSMPEGGEEDAEEGEGVETGEEGERSSSGMDVEAEAEADVQTQRGRTRGVNGVGKKGRKKAGGMGIVKEESGHGDEMMIL
ncbi:hypothetical protein C0995_010539 [Termitomyces sp. Mi166|nr:hypothetical protein C0995_010539 [Termitomyces sp. Mi166\